MRRTHRKGIFFFKIVLSILLMSGCPPKPTVETAKQLFNNNIILLDLSDRIDNPGQIDKDKQIIYKIFDLFEERQKHIKPSADVFTIAIAKQKDSKIDSINFENSLTIDMGKLKDDKEYFTKKEALRQSIESIYETAKSSPTHGADIYTFFQSELSSYLKNSDEYRNKLFILTDGYLSFDESAQRPKGTYISSADLKTLRASGTNWENVFYKNNMGLNSENIHINTKNLQVMLSEITPKNSTENVSESEIIKKFWEKWLRGIGIFDKPIFTLQRIPVEILENEFIKFLEQKTLEETLKIPIKLKGKGYESRLHEKDEIVQNLRGKYLIIDISNGNNVPLNKISFFEKGKYTLNYEDYKTGVEEFNRSVKKILENSPYRETYEIFFKGKADALPFKGDRELEQGYDGEIYKSFEVYPKYLDTNNLFLMKPKKINIDKLTNENLPNLRARFLQITFDALCSGSEGRKSKESKILDGSVADDISEYLRNGEFILYLPKDLFEE